MLRNRVFWEIAKEREAKPTARGLRSLDRSFSRALAGLARSKALRVVRRKLVTVADFSSDYPFRTKDPAIRALRDTFVPLLAERLSQVAQSFPSAYGEGHLLGRRAARDPSWFERQSQAWIRIEHHLLNPGDLTPRAQKALVEVLAKGREYFEGRPGTGARATTPSPIEVRGRSLYGLTGSLKDAGYETSALEEWYRQVFPEPETQHVELKRALYRIAQFDRSSNPSLRRETKEWLLATSPAAVRALPGHKDASPSSRPRRIVEETQFSSELDRVIDAHVFDAFEYLAPR